MCGFCFRKSEATVVPPGERVPLPFIREIVVNWVKHYDAEHLHPGRRSGEFSAASRSYTTGRDTKFHVLAFRCGVNERRLRQLYSGKFQIGDARNGTEQLVDWVPFDVADKIICGTVGPLAWHVEPLSDFYGPLSIRDWERALNSEPCLGGCGQLVNTHRRDGRRTTGLCLDCWSRKRREERPVRHGSPGEYRRGCRCDKCRAAESERYQQRKMTKQKVAA